MPLNPTSSHGGGASAPLTLTAPNDANPVLTLVAAAGTIADGNTVFSIVDEHGVEQLHLDPDILRLVAGLGAGAMQLSLQQTDAGGGGAQLSSQSGLAVDGGSVRISNAGAIGFIADGPHAAPATGVLANGQLTWWFDQTTGASALGLKGLGAAGGAVVSKYPLRQTSGAPPTVAPVSATAFQCSTTQDVVLVVPVTYNPGVATTATCKVEVSPDNVTFSTLLTITQPVGTVFDGSIEPVTLLVPAAWFVKLTVVNATLGTGTYY